MTTYARITDTGTVAELIPHDPVGRYHPSLTWVEVPETLADWITAGWVWDQDAEAFAPDSLDALVSTAADRLAALRYTHETAGLTLDDGTVIDTGRESQALITGAAALATRDPERSFAFKARSGWVTLTADDTLALAEAVGEHVQACFARERAIATALQTVATTEGATATTLIATYTAEIDTGWPTTEGT